MSFIILHDHKVMSTCKSFRITVPFPIDENTVFLTTDMSCLLPTQYTLATPLHIRDAKESLETDNRGWGRRRADRSGSYVLKASACLDRVSER